MNESVKYGLIFLFLAVSMLALTEIVGRLLKINKEITRKVAHIFGGLLGVYFLPVIENELVILLLTVILTFILFLTRHKKILISVHEVTRETLGSVIFPIPFFICFYFGQQLENSAYFYIPVLLLVFSDPAAALAGNVFGWKRYKIGKSVKSLSGNIAFFITSMVIIIYAFSLYTDYSLMYVLLISVSLSLVVTLFEAVSSRGLDNLSVPLSAVLFLFLLGF